jgi:two-component system, sensor histidine kinase and response regulator
VLTSEEDDDKRKYLSLVQKAAMKLLGIIEDLIETSRLEGDGVRLENNPFLLAPMLNAVLGEHAPLAGSKGLELGLKLHPGLPEALCADQRMLRKVLSMVLGNALKFTSQGEVFLEVQLRKDTPSDMVRFSVSDTGVGIAETDLVRIFNDFTQSDGSVTRAFPGLGLGLTLARRIAELMGGRIWAEARPGGGSVFRFEIPLTVPDPPHYQALP